MSSLRHKYGQHVYLTEKEYTNLLRKFGQVQLNNKIDALNKRINRYKKNGRDMDNYSYYKALLRIQETQTVEPIRSREKIEELKELVRRQSDRNYFLVVLGLNIGARIGDLLKLRVKDVRNKTYITLIEEKTNKTKRFKINKTLLQTINEYIYDKEDNEYLFPSQKGNLPITRVQAYRILKEAGEKLGLENIGSHSLRKSMGYHMYQKNKDAEVLRRIFNHSSPSITQRYIGVSQDEIDRAIDDFSL